MGNAISIVCDYLSSIKSKLPPISIGSERHVFVDGDTLYIQFIKNGGFGNKEFNIVYVNLQNNAKLSTHFFLLNDNESYKENDFVELRFAEDHFERRRCMCSESLNMVRELVPGFKIKSDVSSIIKKKDEKVVLNEETERVLVLKAPEYANFVVLALMRIIGLAITQKVVKGMTLAKLLTMLRIANKLKIKNTDGSIDAPSTFFFVAKSTDLKLTGAEILDSDIGEATITSGKLVSATAHSPFGKTSLLDSAAAETLNYSALKKKDLSSMDASLNKIYAGQNSYHIHAMKDIDEMGSAHYIPSYMLETSKIVKEGFARAFTMLDELHVLLEKIEVNHSLNNYINRYFSSFIAKKHLNTVIEIFKNMVRDAAGFLKKEIDTKLKNIYICSSDQIVKKSSSGKYYVSPLINSTSNFEELPLAESVLNDKGEACIIFFSDATYIPDLSCPDVIKRISLHDVVETIFHEIMHVILRERVNDWFYIALEENGKFPSLAKSIEIFYNFINDDKMHPKILCYIEELCQVNKVCFNSDNIKKIMLSSLFKANVMLGNADCLALYLRDIADFAARTNVEKILGRYFQAALRA